MADYDTGTRRGRGTQVPAARRPGGMLLAAAGVVVLAAALAACSGSKPAPTPGSNTAAPTASGAVTSTGGPGATASAGAGATPTAKTLLELQAAKTGCKVDTALQHLDVASGALHVYVTKPQAAGTLRSSTDVAVAARAAGRAATELTAATRFIAGCPKNVHGLLGVTKQTAAQVAAVSRGLAAGTVDERRIQASDALFADVVSQARLLKLTVEDKAPPAASL